MKILFEDNKNSPVSQLLLSSFYGSQMTFCESCTRVPSQLKRVFKENSDDEIFVFLDVVPQNLQSILCYKKLHASEIYQNNKNIHLIPIFCIEYYVCLLLQKLNLLSETPRIKDLVDFIFNKKYNVKLSEEHLAENSLERWLKHILKSQCDCLRNSISEKYPNRGLFYLNDCPNSNCTSCSSCIMERTLKAELLYLLLPISTGDEEYLDYLKSLGISYTKTSASEAYHLLIEEYRTICNALGVCLETLALSETWR